MLSSITLAALLAGCTSPGATTEERTHVGRASDVLLVRTESRLRAVATDAGGVSFGFRNALAAPDNSRLFAASSDGSQTSLRTLEIPSGELLAKARVPGTVLPRTVSGSGEYVALAEPRRPGATPWLPDGRKRSRLLVADPSGDSRARTFDLRGNFEPEAFSTDDAQLFMIEYMPAIAPSHYAVRRLNLATGKVSPIARLKQSAPGQMRGTGRMQVMSPAGHELYTLYTRQGPNYAHGETEHRPGMVHAFVHVLNLRHAWAHCVDLPMPFGTGLATSSALAISDDGRRLYVADWSNGAVAIIEPGSLRVARTARLRLGSADDHTYADVGGNGTLYLAGNSQVVAVEPERLRVIARWHMGGEVSGLGVSPDGRRIYVALGRRIVALDPGSGRRLGEFAAPGTTAIEHIAEA
jgi:hypothetical protein